MFDKRHADKYTSLKYNSRTGTMDREWLQYADGTFEPRRKGEFVSRKKRFDDPAKDWWVTEKPQDWDPAEHGFSFTLNHDYKPKAKPGTGVKPPDRPGQQGNRQDFFLRKGDKATGRTMEMNEKDRRNLGKGRILLAQDKGEQEPSPRRSTLGRGKAAYDEFEAREKEKTTGDGTQGYSGNGFVRGKAELRQKVSQSPPSPGKNDTFPAAASRESPGKRDRDHNWWVSRKTKDEQYDSSKDVFYPTEEARTTSGFGERIHPFTGRRSQHDAVDYGQNSNGVGRNVYATVDGTVIGVGKDRKGANYVVIEDSEGNRHGYWHTETKLKPGTKLRAGDPFGNTDLSGRTDGAHLHYNIKSGDQFIDPQIWLSRRKAKKIKNKP